MTVKFKTLTGNDLLKIFANFGFDLIGQKGSHFKIRRVLLGNNENLIIPNRNPVKVGTLKSIFNQANKYLKREDLYKYFYNE